MRMRTRSKPKLELKQKKDAKRKYEITNANIAIIESGAEILQVNAKVTEYLGINHGEHGEEIPRTKSKTVSVAIPVLNLPIVVRDKNEYVMDKVKTAYKRITQTETEAKAFVGYTMTE